MERQEEIVREMERDHHPEAAARARHLLEIMRVTLGIARRQLEDEKARERARVRGGTRPRPGPTA